MNISAPFIKRPIATTLMTIAISLAGILGFYLLPVAPLPQIEFPTILVQANLAGASPETMAATVATPLEKTFTSIAGITELTSVSSLGATRITLQFDLSKNIDSVAREVQSAINAARVLLPANLPSNPSYRKINPADSPVMLIALTSDILSRGQMYDIASTLLAQPIAQAKGVGQVVLGGGALPAVRVALNLPQLNAYGISLDNVKNTIANNNVNKPKGFIQNNTTNWQINANDQTRKAQDYLPLIIKYTNNNPVYLRDVAKVTDGLQDSRNMGLTDGKQAIQILIYRQPNANILETIEAVKKILPSLEKSIPKTTNLSIALERTNTIKASLLEVERSLIISIILVILVVYAFLRNARATLIPAIVIPVSLLGTFCAMYFLGYSLNNLSLIALTVATGFVVDDAIIVIENIMRYQEKGISPLRAALKGAKDVGFTVLSMSISLIAVFIPVLAMGGIIGRLFREFAVTLSVAILISLVVSLTTTPMLCAYWLKNNHTLPHKNKKQGKLFEWIKKGYAKSLYWSLAHIKTLVLLFFITIGLNVWLYSNVDKGFFPQQDTGLLVGNMQADQAVSFQSMSKKITQFVDIVKADKSVAHVNAFTSTGQSNSGLMFITLKPLDERKINADEVIDNIRRKVNKVAGASLFLQSVQDFRMGGRPSGAQYQFTLQSDNLDLLKQWEPKIREAFSKLSVLKDVNTDAQNKGAQTSIIIDREKATALGVNAKLVDSTLANAFGQRQVSTIYDDLNQYRVIMEADTQFLQNASSLDNLYIINDKGISIALSSFATIIKTNAPLNINHQDQLAASTISFNLPIGVSLSQASEAIQQTMNKIGVPSAITGKFQGSAKAFQSSLSSQPILILAALIAIYIVLGILYESLIHPLTILSTLPSAGIGAISALMLLGKEFNIIAFIGIILLIGIVKKNAIMMIDVAIEKERIEKISAKEAIYQACLLRLRPILMTTLSALFGALPLVFVFGEGSELRQPLGIAIVGGLLISQVLTLYTTPVIYLAWDRLRKGKRVH